MGFPNWCRKMGHIHYVLGGESKVRNGTKSCTTQDALTTSIILGPKGLTGLQTLYIIVM